MLVPPSVKRSTATLPWAWIEAKQSVGGAQSQSTFLQLEGALDQAVKAVVLNLVSEERKFSHFRQMCE